MASRIILMVLKSLRKQKKLLIDILERIGKGNRKTTYKLRDWIFSRQRYWGEPIPLIHCAHCGIVPVPEDQITCNSYPKLKTINQLAQVNLHLAGIPDWVNVTCPCKGPAKRETNTMPQWAGSCWYFLRYPNPDIIR